MTDIKSLYRQHEGRIMVEIVLDNVMELYNSLDPSPFRKRELDHAAEEYIYNAIDDFPLKEPMEIVVYLPPSKITPDVQDSIRSGIHNHFNYRLAAGERELRRTLRTGRKFLVVGVVILVAALLIRESLSLFPSTVENQAVQNILLILSWVAIWEPIHIFLYERSPISQRKKIYEKITSMPVFVKAIQEISPL
ncbi:hypothetical protein J2741_001666 [Methanolinea mesophila]|uniref:hypothetical protein n=1 Tax=Methanolinea mesophila TaxID=547055 RepID=UPI001AE2573D|nr:hypothetical protein [Methanolinea mesophila]MBP1929119.1 hypothetical protein [Methanolinea mesophila]